MLYVVYHVLIHLQPPSTATIQTLARASGDILDEYMQDSDDDNLGPIQKRVTLFQSHSSSGIQYILGTTR